jgi:hypothetical protein
VRAVDHGDALAFVDGAGEIGSGRAFIIGVGDDQQDVGFVAVVRLRQRR